MKPMTFDQALDVILENTVVCDCGQVSLEHCLGRISCPGNRARLAIPCYDQSTRDGFVLRGKGRPAQQGRNGFMLGGEIPAGPSAQFEIGPDQAYRIMTGAYVPQGAERVVPQEACTLSGNEVLVPVEIFSDQRCYIRRIGSEQRRQEALVPPGTELGEFHLARLAAAGNELVDVYRRPRVAFFCSGSELVMADQRVDNGQKVSSNHYLLKSLIGSYRGVAKDYGIVADRRKDIAALLRKIQQASVDIIISTGGVGPGKYDLLAGALLDVGAEVLYRALLVRPGRKTLFGLIGKTIYFGLPGPPSAVNILFHELIGPALDKMRGLAAAESRRTAARLLHDISLKPADLHCFRPGHYELQDGCVRVREAERQEAPNCHIILEPGRSSYSADELVTVNRLDRR